MAKLKQGYRWSGFDWGQSQSEIMIVGIGSIGSYLALTLGRTLHDLILVDGDEVDISNVQGGQLYRSKDIGSKKALAVTEICREFGCTAEIMPITEMYDESIGMTNICLCGLDSMKSRKLVFNAWKNHVNNSDDKSKCLFGDGRTSGELFEYFFLKGDDTESIEKYENEWLFSDEGIPDIECTTKSTTYIGMGIAWGMTGVLNNWLANKALDMEFREVPFHSRMYTPIFQFEKTEINELV